MEHFSKTHWKIILVVAFGYYVDLYDLLLFSSIRKQSLIGIGIINSKEITETGLTLLNIQLIGMVVGGVILGVIADKIGRLKILFFSIVTYSISNLLNAGVQTVWQYEILRFVAGFGLSGELGVGISYITETIPKEKRTIATMLVSTIGMLGAVTAAVLAQQIDWRSTYLIGGIMGLILLIFRITVTTEPIIFNEQTTHRKHRGNVLTILQKPWLTIKYLACILVGAPVFFIVGILVTLSPEFGRAFNMANEPEAAKAVAITYLMISIFDIFSGLLSKKLKKRRETMALFLAIQLIAIINFLFFPTTTLNEFYIKCAFLGVGVGYWGIMITNASEQFGINLRATVTTSVPNFIRGLLTPITLIFRPLSNSVGIIPAASWIGIGTIIVAVIAVFILPERFETEANFVE